MEVPRRSARRHSTESSPMLNKPYLVQHNPMIRRSMEDWKVPAPGRTIPLYVSVTDEKGPVPKVYQTPKSDATITSLARTDPRVDSTDTLPRDSLTALIEDGDKQILEARCVPNTRFGSTSPRTAVFQKHVLGYVPPETPMELKETSSSLDLNTLVSKVPSDNRIQLVFDLQRMLNAEKALSNFYSPDVQNTEDQLTKLREFEERGTSLDAELFNFCILDHIPSPKTGTITRAIYRMGHGRFSFPNDDNTITEDPETKQDDGFVAPWRRVIVCKGLSMVTTAGTQINNESAKDVLPCIDTTGGTSALASNDFARAVTDASISEAIELHMNCTKRTGGDRINPYLDASREFHITFYEVIVHRFSSSKNEFWKHGPFYVHPGAPWFRRSAITTLVATEDGYASGEKASRPKSSSQWGTILVLCPPETRRWFKLFIERNAFPRLWKSVLDFGLIQFGEVAVIKEAYSMLTSRWYI